jgi:hypothetical protein
VATGVGRFLKLLAANAGGTSNYATTDPFCIHVFVGSSRCETYFHLQFTNVILADIQVYARTALKLYLTPQIGLLQTK